MSFALPSCDEGLVVPGHSAHSLVHGTSVTGARAQVRVWSRGSKPGAGHPNVPRTLFRADARHQNGGRGLFRLGCDRGRGARRPDDRRADRDLPVSAGPAYVFLALDHDPQFISQSALASLALNAATGDLRGGLRPARATPIVSRRGAGRVPRLARVGHRRSRRFRPRHGSRCCSMSSSFRSAS